MELVIMILRLLECRAMPNLATGRGSDQNKPVNIATMPRLRTWQNRDHNICTTREMIIWTPIYLREGKYIGSVSADGGISSWYLIRG